MPHLIIGAGYRGSFALWGLYGVRIRGFGDSLTWFPAIGSSLCPIADNAGSALPVMAECLPNEGI